MGFFAERVALGQSIFITWWMLTFKRNYVIEKIKAPLLKTIVSLATRYPIPTKALTATPNTHYLLDMEEKFFKYENNKGRNALFRALWRIFIVEYEHDRYYRDRIDWFIEELVEAVKRGRWEPRQAGHPKRCWKEKYD